jgi:transcriptional regulator with XRE-family HTH domain
MKTKIEQFVIDKVREMRQKENLSQAKLADLLALTKGFVGNAENPNRIEKYNLNHINELAIIFNCSITDFFPKEPFENNKHDVEQES